MVPALLAGGLIFAVLGATWMIMATEAAIRGETKSTLVPLTLAAGAWAMAAWQLVVSNG